MPLGLGAIVRGVATFLDTNGCETLAAYSFAA
jgi:hypothetical protein